MSFFGKVIDLLGIVDYADDDEMEKEEYGTSSVGASSYTPSTSSFAPSSDFSNDNDAFSFSAAPKNTLKSSGKVTTINSDQIKMIVINPDKYDEAREICDYIKDKKPVVVNLESMDIDVAQRVMDFLSGSCYSLNGNVQRVARNIFIVAPNNIDIASDFKSDYKGKGNNSNSLSWMSFNKTAGTTTQTAAPTTTTPISPASLGLKN